MIGTLWKAVIDPAKHRQVLNKGRYQLLKPYDARPGSSMVCIKDILANFATLVSPRFVLSRPINITSVKHSQRRHCQV